MLLNFTFKNYRSFRDEKTFSMIAAPVHELDGSLYEAGGEKVLPVGVVYGANSSGKSNMLKALSNMRSVLLDSVKLNPSDTLDYEPFLLDVDSPQHPTFYEIEFNVGKRRFRYGFEFDRTTIHSEWLFGTTEGKKEQEYFTRAGNNFSIPSKTRFAEGIGKEISTPDNRLFLSLVAQLNGKVSQSVIGWFGSIDVLSGMRKSAPTSSLSLAFLSNDNLIGDNARKFFQRVGLGFKDVRVEDCDMLEEIFSIENIADAFKGVFEKTFKGETMQRVVTLHDVYNADGSVNRTELFPLSRMESLGTQKIIDLSGQIFMSLAVGTVLVVDELDAKLHPILTRNIVNLFTDKAANPKGAQLIFATHDTNLLNLKYLRRDQIWFTEKDSTESSDLYCLVEFRDENGAKVRNDRSIAKDYINGRYGAIPYIK